MVSMNPSNEIYDMRQMYNFSDITVQTEKKYTKNSLTDLILNHPEFQIFSRIIQTANYADKLSEIQSNVTLFVPVDEYLKQKYSENYLNSIDKGLAIEILNMSMMNREINKQLLQSSPFGKFPMINKRSVHIKTIQNETYIQHKIKILAWDNKATNGIFHVTDDFLLPVETSF